MTLSKRTTIRIATNNIMSLPKNTDVIETLKTAPHASIVMVQECDLEEFKDALYKLGDHRVPTRIKDGASYSCFILYDPAIWQHNVTHFVKAYDGVSGISYTRHIAFSNLTHIGLGQSMVFVSYHAVTGGNDRDRRKMRREGDNQVRKIVKEAREAGLPVILGADMNRGTTTFLSRVHVRHYIDHIYAWASKTLGIRHKSTRVIETASDHDVLVTSLILTAK